MQLVSQVWNHSSQDGKGVGGDYDCIAVWTMPDRAALDELFRIAGDLEIGKAFYDDDEKFLDRDAVIAINCEDGDVVNTGTGVGRGTLEGLAGMVSS